MTGVAGTLVALSSAPSTTQRWRKLYSKVTVNPFWSQVFGIAFSSRRWLRFFMLFVPVMGLYAGRISIIGLAFNLHAHHFVWHQMLSALWATPFE